MKLLIAAICAATSSPVETTLNSLSLAATSGCAAYALAVLIIWMRQVLAMKPLASAIRYGPFFCGYWNIFTFSDHGAKHFGSELAPVTILGPAACADNVTTLEKSKAAPTPEMRGVKKRDFMSVPPMELILSQSHGH